MLTIEVCPSPLFSLPASPPTLLVTPPRPSPNRTRHGSDVTPNFLSWPWPIELAGSSAHLRQLHAHALRAGVLQPHFWNAVARGYSSDGAPTLALHLCLQMLQRDEYTFPLAFKLCSQLSALEQAVGLHAHLLKLGFSSDTHSLNALITLYANFGHLDSARQLFDGIPTRTVSSWSAMIAAYDRNARPLEALFTFLGMVEDGMKPDEAALVSTLAACNHGGCLEFGKAIQAFAVVYGLGLGSVGFATALVDFYAKCGELDYARKVFERMAYKNVLSWSAMIGGLAMHGFGVEAVELFDEMIDAGVKPTSVTMTNVLSACSHIGLVEQGTRLFKLMKEEYQVEPRIEHYGCMVDLLGRAGLFEEAQEFVEAMPMKPTPAIWRSILGAACTHGELEVGRLAGERLAETEEMVAGDYVMLANLYARYGLWEEVGSVRTEMNDLGVRKVAGFSSVEVNGEVHRFVMGDKSHPLAHCIHDMLELLTREILQTRKEDQRKGCVRLLLE